MRTIKVYGASVAAPTAQNPLMEKFMERFRPGPASPKNLKNQAWRARTGFDNIMTREELALERPVILARRAR